MKREAAGSEAMAPEFGRLPRCACCNGVIEKLHDQDIALGLNLALGLVSDECALICDGCTSKLILARQEQKSSARVRR
jgi:hypothetical protein